MNILYIIIIIFHIFVSSFFMSIKRVTYSSSNYFLITYQYQLKDLIFAHIFKDTYFESSQIHQVTRIYRFEHINHNITLNFLF